MTEKKIHFRCSVSSAYKGYHNSLCGIRVNRTTNNKAGVTCLNCLKVLDAGKVEKEAEKYGVLV